MWRKYGISIKDWKKIQRSGGVLIKKDPDTGVLTHINRRTGETLLVEPATPSGTLPGEITPEMAPPKKPYKPPPGYNQYGQWMGEGYIHEEQEVKPPKTTVAKPPPKKAPTFNEANQEAIIKKLNEKFPTTDKQKRSGMEYVFKYNPDTDGFDQFVKAFGKEYTPADFNRKFGAIMQANVASLSGSGNLLSNIVDSIKGAVNQLPDIKIDPTDITNVIDDLTPDSVDDLSNQISDNTPDIKITDTSTQDIVNNVSDSTPDIKITDTSTQDVANVISDNTPDIKITETSTGDLVDQLPTVPEILDKVDETGAAAAEGVKGAVDAVADAGTEIGTTVTDAIGEVYEGSDVDTLLEDTKDVGDFMLDTVITIATGEPHGLVAEAQEDIQNTATTLQEAGDNISETTTTLGEVVTDTVNTSNQVIGEVGTNAAETVVNAADDVVNAFVDAGILTRETKGGAVTEETRGGDVVRDEDLIQLGKKKSDLKAKKKRGKKGLRIDYGVNIPGVGKSGIAA